MTKTKSTLVKVNNKILLFEGEIQSLDKLDSDGVYMLSWSKDNGFYLEKKDSFNLPDKIYGKEEQDQLINRWLSSHENNTNKNTGIILSGKTGGGKTVLASRFCIEAKKPVIVINQAYSGVEFINYMTQPLFKDTIVFIDEYEKIFKHRVSRMHPDDDEDDINDARRSNNRNSSHEILQLFDGTFDTRFIFLLTVNEMDISPYLINRLGRLKFRKHYANLSEELIREIAEDFLDNKEHIESLLDLFDELGTSSFDLLTNVIKEMNLFKETATETAKYLNLEPEFTSFELFLTTDTGKIAKLQSINSNGGPRSIGNKALTFTIGYSDRMLFNSVYDYDSPDNKARAVTLSNNTSENKNVTKTMFGLHKINNKTLRSMLLGDSGSFKPNNCEFLKLESITPDSVKYYFDVEDEEDSTKYYFLFEKKKNNNVGSFVM